MPNEPLNGVPTPQPAAAPAPAAAPVAPVVTAPTPTPAATPVAQAPIAEPTPAVAQPEGMSNRTQENIDKLLESNQRLYQANELLREAMTQRNQPNQQFAQQQQQQTQTPAQQTAAQISDFIERDPKTGEQYINETKLRSTMSDIQQRAARAEETASNYARIVEQREKERQNSEAFTAYPDLNPRSTAFDARFSNQTRALITDSMLNPHDYNGRPLTFREAADFIRETTGKPVSQQPVAAPVAASAQPAAATIAPVAPTTNQINKEQASLSATPQPVQQQSDIAQEDLARLQKSTRMGDDEALAARLIHTDHIYGPNSSPGAEVK